MSAEDWTFGDDADKHNRAAHFIERTLLRGKKMRTFYIATGLERAEEQRAAAKQLEALGFTNAYDWTAHGSVQSEGPERIREVSESELGAVLEADLFVALLPGGRGTHTEFGAALANKRLRAYKGDHDRTLLLVGPINDASGRTCAFYLNPFVDERFDTIGELVAWLKSWRRCNPLPTARSA